MHIWDFTLYDNMCVKKKKWKDKAEQTLLSRFFYLTELWKAWSIQPWLRSSFSSFGFFFSHRRCRFIREGAFVHEVNTFQIVSIVYLAEGLDKYKSRVSSRL